MPTVDPANNSSKISYRYCEQNVGALIRSGHDGTPLYKSIKNHFWTPSLTVLNVETSKPIFTIKRDGLFQLVPRFTVLDDQDQIICYAKFGYYGTRWDIFGPTRESIGSLQSFNKGLAMYRYFNLYLLDYKVIMNKEEVAQIKCIHSGGHLNRYVLDIERNAETSFDFRIGLAMIYMIVWPHFGQTQKRSTYDSTEGIGGIP